jgi:hypothetical protein
MRRVLLSILGILIVLGLFAAAGFAGYRFGFAQGAQTQGLRANGATPQIRPFGDSDRGRMPMMPNFGWGRGMHRGFGIGGFPMMGFGLFGLLGFFGRILFFALVLWFIFWLFTRSGWRLTRTAPVTTAPSAPVTAPPAAPVAENENTNTDVTP